MGKVLVTGASGFVGSWITRILMDEGHEVRVGDLPHACVDRLVQSGAESVVCDVTRRGTVRKSAAGVDTVVHVAGLFDLTAPSDALWRVNAEGARVVARAAVREGAKRLVLISTSGVYGRCGADVDEDGPKKPINAYERSKWAGEKMAVAECQREGLPIAVIRPTLIYGPWGRYGLAPWIAFFALMQRKNGGPLRIAQGGPIGHHVHVEDVARAVAHLVAAKTPIDGVFNLADEAPLSGGDLIRLVAGLFDVQVRGGLPWWFGKHINLLRPLAVRFLRGWNPKLAFHWNMLVAQTGIEPELSPRIDVGWLDYMVTDHTYRNDRIKALGFRFRHPDVRIGLPETIAWYREQRWIP